MLKYDQNSYTERALALLEKDITYLANSNYGYGMPTCDVKQELRIQIWRKIDKYNPKKKSLRTWAQTVMRRKLMDMYKIHSRKIESKVKVNLENEEELFYLIGVSLTHPRFDEESFD